MSQERRQFVRVEFDAPAQLTTADDAFSVRVHDLSLKGALLSLPVNMKLERGTLCQLNVPLPGLGNHVLMSCEVAHVEGPYVGLACHGIDLDSVTHLRRIIELQLADPALLDRDLAALLMQNRAH